MASDGHGGIFACGNKFKVVSVLRAQLAVIIFPRADDIDADAERRYFEMKVMNKYSPYHTVRPMHPDEFVDSSTDTTMTEKDDERNVQKYWRCSRARIHDLEKYGYTLARGDVLETCSVDRRGKASLIHMQHCGLRGMRKGSCFVMQVTQADDEDSYIGMAASALTAGGLENPSDAKEHR